MSTWILIVTIWFNGAMNSYDVLFMTEEFCVAAKNAIHRGMMDQWNNTELGLPPVINAVCVEDYWEEDYD